MNPQTRPAAIEQLAAVAQRAFPRPQGPVVIAAGASCQEAWRQLCMAAVVDAWTLAAAIAKDQGLELASDLSAADPAALHLIPQSYANQNLLFPVAERAGHLVVALANPLDHDLLERTRFLVNRGLELRVAPPDDIETAISKAYGRASQSHERNRGTLTLSQTGAPIEATATDNNAVVELTRTLIVKTIEERGSDLHVQPFAGGGMVRIRVDGVLRRVTFIPGNVRESLLRYVKAQCGMDPTNHRIPQDGRMSLVLGSKDFDLRISTLPANRGETLVIRILDQGRANHLSQSGFSVAALLTLRRLAANTAGVILVTGPTGSGKSTTLYGLLTEINRVGVNIVTVENPVEYRIAGVSQVEVDPKAGLTFASALRSILRQDPDIILIGEIRDAETADIAMQAALTGHLVLSTLHTNDAMTALPRLLDLGVDASVLADAMIGVVAQRLFRRLCSSCREPVRAPLRTDEQFFQDLTSELPAYRSVGCAACGGTGYHGRFPVAEVAEMSPALASAISSGETDLTKLRALSKGPLSVLASTAARRVISGDTTAMECMRVIGQRFWSDLAREFGRPAPAVDALSALTGDAQDDKGLGVLLYCADDGASAPWVCSFEEQHFSVHRASAPEEARRLLEQQDHILLAVIDLDTGSPAGNLEITRQLRTALAWARLPTVIIVPAEDAQLRSALESHGVTDYLVKPVTANQLVEKCRAILAR